MAAAASEVAISRLIGKSQEILSKEAVLPRELQTQISEALNILENMLYASSAPGSGLLGADDGSNLQQEHKVLIFARDVEDIMDMFLVKALTRPKSQRGCLAAPLHGVIHLTVLWIRVRPSRANARILVDKVEELSQHFANIRGIASPEEFHESSKGSRSREYQRSPTILSDESTIVGRKDIADCLADQLIDSERLRVISIVGTEGIGKTALVRSVYNRLETKHQFESQAWICASNAPRLESILVDILKQSPVKELKDLELKGTEDLNELLHKSLIELRYLIVLDDLQTANVLNDLIHILPDSRNGSRIVITCREVDHVPLAREPWVFHLPVEQLDDENSRKLLLEHSSINDSGLREKILGKCNGSPAKIVLFGGLATAFEPNDIESSLTVWLCENKDDLQLPDVMSLSFRSLPPWVKPCFLYLCLFPRESEISARRIFQLWHAEGLVRWDGHSTADDCFKELANRNLVKVVRRREADQSVKTCRLPGHLHDYFSHLPISLPPQVHQNDNKVVLWPSSPTSLLPWLAQYSSNFTSLPLQDAKMATRIQSYISSNTEKSGIQSREVEQLLNPLVAHRDIALLRVLDLEGVYKPKLPKQFGDLLPNLRYLGLRWTILDSLPKSVSKLSRLETLDLKHTNVTKLPSSILSSKYLRHLYLNEVSLDKCKPTKSCLSNIQTLWGISIGAKSSFFSTVLTKLERLRKLGLTCYAEDMREATDSISNLMMLESLRLRSRDLFGQPSKLKPSKGMRNLGSLSKLYLLGGLVQKRLRFLPKNLRVLTLSMSKMKFDPMLELGQLRHLVTLRLFAKSYNGEAMVCKKGSFPSLRVLKLWKLEKLKELHICEGSMKSLEELDVRDCKKLMKITGLEHASELKQITLTQVNRDFAKQVESTLPKTIVTCRAWNGSSPEDKEEAAKLKQEDDSGDSGDDEQDECSDDESLNTDEENGIAEDDDEEGEEEEDEDEDGSSENNEVTGYESVGDEELESVEMEMKTN